MLASASAASSVDLSIEKIEAKANTSSNLQGSKLRASGNGAAFASRKIFLGSSLIPASKFVV